jgi:hypothetical protein
MLLRFELARCTGFVGVGRYACKSFRDRARSRESLSIPRIVVQQAIAEGAPVGLACTDRTVLDANRFSHVVPAHASVRAPPNFLRRMAPNKVTRRFPFNLAQI